MALTAWMAHPALSALGVRIPHTLHFAGNRRVVHAQYVKACSVSQQNGTTISSNFFSIFNGTECHGSRRSTYPIEFSSTLVNKSRALPHKGHDWSAPNWMMRIEVICHLDNCPCRCMGWLRDLSFIDHCRQKGERNNESITKALFKICSFLIGFIGPNYPKQHVFLYIHSTCLLYWLKMHL